MKVKFYFITLDIESTQCMNENFCSSDRVSIYSSRLESDKSLLFAGCGVYTGNRLMRDVSPGNELLVAFRSDESVVSSGYAIHYECTLNTFAAVQYYVAVSGSDYLLTEVRQQSLCFF